jgi:Nucleotide-diphospho-sugar transferase
MIDVRAEAMHCVYVISSSREDYFAEMTAVSIKSLRLSNPNCKITIVIDSLSGNSIGLQFAKNLSDHVIEISSRHSEQIYRSRDLKVRLREIVDGPFIYLDSDTLVVDKIGGLFFRGYDIAAGRDYPVNRRMISPAKAIYGETATMGWSLGVLPYLNSGVFFMDDTEQAYKFSERLASNWQDFCNKLGKPNDQPAFNQAIFDRFHSDPSFKLHIFDHSFNAQVSMDPLLGRNAHIFHIFSGSFHSRQDTVLHVETHRLKGEGYIDETAIRRAIDNGHPWMQLDSPRKVMAHRGYIIGGCKYLISRLFHREI